MENIDLNIENILQITTTADIDRLDITYIPTVKCNYKCSYCIQNNLKNNPLSYISDEDMIKRSMNLRKFIDESNIYHNKENLLIMGGELFVYNNLKELFIDPLLVDDIKQYFTLVTNFSFPIERYVSLYKEINNMKNKKLKYVCSFHEEHINIETFIDKIKTLINETNIDKLTIESVVNDNNLEIIKQAVNYIKNCEIHDKIKIKINLERNKGISHSKETIDFCKNINEDNKKFLVTTKDNRLLKFSREELLNLSDTGYLPTKGMICKSNNNTIKCIFDDCNYKICNCKKDRDRKEEEIICTSSSGCSLCGNNTIYNI